MSRLTSTPLRPSIRPSDVERMRQNPFVPETIEGNVRLYFASSDDGQLTRRHDVLLIADELRAAAPALPVDRSPGAVLVDVSTVMRRRPVPLPSHEVALTFRADVDPLAYDFDPRMRPDLEPIELGRRCAEIAVSFALKQFAWRLQVAIGLSHHRPVVLHWAVTVADHTHAEPALAGRDQCLDASAPSLDRCLQWILSVCPIDPSVREASHPISRAVTALLNLEREHGSTSVVWAMVGIEALYAPGKETILGQLRQRIPTLIAVPSDFRRRFAHAYALRSAIVHGAADLTMPLLDPTGDTMDAEDFATLILVRSLRELVHRGWSTLAFDSVPRGT